MFGRPNQIAHLNSKQSSGSQSENTGRAEDIHKDFHVKKQVWRRASTITDLQKIFEADFQQWHSLRKAKVALLQKAQGLIFTSHSSSQELGASKINHHPF